MRAWRLYARSPAALLGAALVLAVAAMGLLAPLLYPDDPLGLAGGAFLLTVDEALRLLC